MSNSTATQVDLSLYITQAEYARINNIKLGTLSQWAKRVKEGQSIPAHAKNIEFLEVPELSLTLVKK